MKTFELTQEHIHVGENFLMDPNECPIAQMFHAYGRKVSVYESHSEVEGQSGRITHTLALERKISLFDSGGEMLPATIYLSDDENYLGLAEDFQ
jgi:hypothetical protein